MFTRENSIEMADFCAIFQDPQMVEWLGWFGGIPVFFFFGCSESSKWKYQNVVRSSYSNDIWSQRVFQILGIILENQRINGLCTSEYTTLYNPNCSNYSHYGWVRLPASLGIVMMGIQFSGLQHVGSWTMLNWVDIRLIEPLWIHRRFLVYTWDSWRQLWSVRCQVLFSLSCHVGLVCENVFENPEDPLLNHIFSTEVDIWEQTRPCFSIAGHCGASPPAKKTLKARSWDAIPDLRPKG